MQKRNCTIKLAMEAIIPEAFCLCVLDIAAPMVFAFVFGRMHQRLPHTQRQQQQQQRRLFLTPKFFSAAAAAVGGICPGGQSSSRTNLNRCASASRRSSRRLRCCRRSGHCCRCSSSFEQQQPQQRHIGVVLYLVGRYSPVLKLPKISTFALGQSPLTAPPILSTTANLRECSSGVGTIQRKKSSISSCKLK